MKVYEKPRVYIERFELSQHIAACAWDMTNQSDQNQCTAVGDSEWGLPGLAMFTDTPRCDFTPEAFGDDFCYTVGTEGGNLFNS